MKRRPARYRTGIALLFLALAGSALWYVSPAGTDFRLKRMDTPSLLGYTEANPKNAFAFYELGQRMEAQHLEEEAQNNYARAAKVSPRQAQYWVKAVSLALKRGDGERTFALAEQALENVPESAELHRIQGEAFARAGNWRQAADAYRQAVKRDASKAEAWDGLARVLLETNGFAEAALAAEKATQLQPERANFWTHLGRARRLLSDGKGAQSALEQARKLAPDDAESNLEWGQWRAATAQSEADYAEAEQAFQRSAAGWKNQALAYDPWYQLGQLFLARRRYSDAQRAFRKALECHQDDSAATFALSRALALGGDQAGADILLVRFRARSAYLLQAAQLQMRLAREPKRADLAARLGDLHAANGEREKAMAAWEHSLQMDPAQPLVVKKRDAMRK